MAISVGKTIPELVKLTEELGLTVTPSGKNGKFMKEDYIVPVREYHLGRLYGDTVPDHLKMIMSMKSPMLAKRIDGLRQELQNEIWGSDLWEFEEKLDGVRILLVKDNSGLYCYSRHNSDVDFLPLEFSNKILYEKGFDIDKIKDNFILDTEITSDLSNINTVVGKYGVSTESMLQVVTALISSDPERAKLIQEREDFRLRFNVFDCVYYNGQWITNEPLEKRRELARELYMKLVGAGFKISEVRRSVTNKKQFYKSIVLNGGEGCIAKHSNGIYVPDTSRRNDGWVKIKRSISELSLEESFGDTIDAWISGFEKGTEGKGFEDYVGTIILSTYLRRDTGELVEHEIARVSGIDMKLREDMTLRVNGVVTLNPAYYNRVVEVDGANVSARARRLQHAVFLGFRNEKNKDDCILEESFLNSMVM